MLAERKAKEEAEAAAAAAKAAEEVVIEVDVARPVVEGRLREGKGDNSCQIDLAAIEIL